MTLAQPKQILRWHLLVIAILASAHIAVIAAAAAGHMRLLGLHRQFSLVQESNIPTTIAALAMIMAAILAGIVSRLETRPVWRRGWLGVAIALVFMAIDEAAQVHEMFSLISLGSIEGSEHSYNWVAAYAAFTLVTGLYFFHFWLSLPPGIKSGLALAGGIFVASAIGMEIVEMAILHLYGVGIFYTATGQLVLFVEEVGEMIGVAVANYTILRRLHALTPEGATLQWSR
ncbi:hypothetical protein NYR55_12105 [Sphingomonas sp. BGYR3]|uniref:hypothetical protein n=1 Tax=Sphingomonas sp. BGYR3 TaxID=2975483 RepID=UPI0021A81FA7|nr:hypothetical protein [Sphingomonas sp. BGYR3]MDG5489359.1 hypothetical protein [Sphingomonas sp. BGYR3]